MGRIITRSEKRKNSNEDVFERMTPGQAVRTMAVPAVVSQLIILIYNMADTFYLGQTGNPQMVAGVSLVLPVFNVATAVGSLFGFGGGALIPKLLAADEHDEAAKTAAYCVRLTLLTALFFSGIMLAFMRPILTLLGAGETTIGYAQTYVLTVLVAGGIPTILSNGLSNLIRSLGMSREAGIGVALGGVLNLFLDPLFMFVLLPKGQEVLGVGIATMISNVVACIWCLMVFFRKQKTIRVNLTETIPRAENRRSVLTVGVSNSMGALLFDVGYMVLDRLTVGYGDAALAAMGIVLKVERLPQQTGVGLCQAMVPLVAYSYAKKDFDRTRKIIASTLKAGLVVAVISIILYELFPSRIVRLFMTEPETLSIGTRFLQIRAIAAVIMFFCFFPVFLFQAVGDGHMSMWMLLLRWVFLNIPLLFLMNAIFGMYGLAWAQVTSDVITMLISIMVLKRYMRHWSNPS